MKTVFTVLLAILIGFSGFAQEEENDHKEAGKFGANKLHFVHSHLSLGFMMPPSDGVGADVLYGKSHSVTYGVRYKLKLADFFALGTGLNYTYKVWHLNQNDRKVVPTSLTFDKEKFISHNLGADVYLRFNFGKRKNTVGNYLDLGGYGEWAYANHRRITNDSNTPDAALGFNYSTGTEYKLNYFEKLNYGLSARIGYGKFVLFGKYRMSDMFTPEFKDAITDTELPRLIIGLELGFHK